MHVTRSHPVLLKIATCLLAAMACASTMTMVLSTISPFSAEVSNLWGNLFLVIIVVGIGLFIGWQWREQKRSSALPQFAGSLQGFIRWWLAYQICTYRFAKILHTQFQSSPYAPDMVAGELSGFSLTWFYYGHSYTMAVIIGAVQIIGSILLLFHRTALLGVFALLPVMVNVVLINLFYAISGAALINSLFYTLALLYFLLLDVPLLKDLVQRYGYTLWQVPVKAFILKNILRISPVIVAFVTLYSFVRTDKSDHILYGAYRVDEFIRNGKVQARDAWLHDSTVFSRLYFSGREGCAFSPNPFRYKQSESLCGNYQFDEESSKLKIMYYFGHYQDTMDSVGYVVSDRTFENMTLNTVCHNDTLQMRLTRIR